MGKCKITLLSLIIHIVLRCVSYLLAHAGPLPSICGRGLGPGPPQMWKWVNQIWNKYENNLKEPTRIVSQDSHFTSHDLHWFSKPPATERSLSTELNVETTFRGWRIENYRDKKMRVLLALAKSVSNSPTGEQPPPYLTEPGESGRQSTTPSRYSE